MTAPWPGGRRLLGIDVAVAVAATGAELGFLLDDGQRAGVPLVLLAVASGAALLGRRRAPLVVLAATLAGALALVAVDASPAGVPALVALYTTAELHEPRLSLLALVPTVLVLAIGSIAAAPIPVVVWALGAYARSRDGARRREREHLAQIAVHEERTAIARELHDIVAHSVTVMLLGVRGARDVLRTEPQAAEDALAGVEASGEQSLAELRRVLALLRSPDGGAELHPQPSLADLEDLVASYRQAGLPVRLEAPEDHRDLPASVELSVYRVVEEALTNATKHAAPASVVVTLSVGATSLDVEITDDGKQEPGHRRPAPADGHGIVGMSERIALLGGELESGERAGGGYVVRARVPLEAGA